MTDHRPTAGQLEQRTEAITADEQRIRGVIPYGSESRDMGGWTEVIERGALSATRLDDLVATVDHVGVPLGRYPTTLQLEDRADGLHWSVDPPQSRADIREAVQRGDLRAGSWRMRVARDEWRGNVRHIHEIAELRDVAIATSPAYPSAAVELRTHDPAEGQEHEMSDTARPADAPDITASTTETVEDRTVPATGGLHVEDRVTVGASRGLADEFRAAGFPGDTATIPWETYESRALTWTGSVDNVAPDRREGVPFGFDQRFAYPAFPTVAVDEGTTAVPIMQQTARTLATAANVVRAIDAVTAKPETASTVTLTTVSMKQVANIVSGIPNVLLETTQITSVIENDLRLALAGGLDKLVLDGIATAGFTAPGTDPLIVSIRKAVTTLRAAGYNPNLVLLTPANDETLDTLVSGISGGVNDYVFAPAQFAPSTIFGMQRRVSTTIPAPAVVDTNAFGKLYASRVSLARFEESAGATNSSLLRLETHAAFGVERVTAATRIAAA